MELQPLAYLRRLGVVEDVARLLDGVDLESAARDAKLRGKTRAAEVQVNGKKLYVKFIGASGREVAHYTSEFPLVIERLGALLQPYMAGRGRDYDTLVRTMVEELGLLLPIAQAFLHIDGVYHVAIVYPFIEANRESRKVSDLIEAAEKGRPLNAGKARDIACKVLRVGVRVESAGVLHGDIRPANTLLTPDLKPVVIDVDGATLLDSVRRGYRPLYKTDYESLEYELPKPDDLHLDYVGVMWTMIASASSTREDVARDYSRLCCGEKFIEKHRKVLSEVLGDSFFDEHYLPALRGSMPERNPLRSLYESISRGGVC